MTSCSPRRTTRLCSVSESCPQSLPDELAARAYARCLDACRKFDSSLEFDLEPRAVRVWWTDTSENHSEGLAVRIRAVLSATQETPQGCLAIVSAGEPERVHWRGHRQKVYQLVAWGLQGALPTRRSVVRHLCHNRLCLHPEHLRIGTQAQNLFDQRQRRAGIGLIYEGL